MISTLVICMLLENQRDFRRAKENSSFVDTRAFMGSLGLLEHWYTPLRYLVLAPSLVLARTIRGLISCGAYEVGG
jgi:hypothetical protein